MTMMGGLARALVRRTVAWVVVVTVLLTAAGALLLAKDIAHENDLLAFLPAADPGVALFNRLNRRFGGLDVALVGIETDDVFTADFLERLRSATRELEDSPGLDRVLSLANVVDFSPDALRGGIVTGPLVREVPRSEAARRALRTKVMARELVVGNLVARDGRAAMINCFLAHGSDPRQVAASVRAIVLRHFSAAKTYWGGGPFVSSFIYNSTQRDMRRLTPWAVLAMIVVMMIAFRDVGGTVLALLSTSIGIVISLGLMVLFGVKVNLALGTMPVILFAVGSAYGIHILARYYASRRTRDPVAAVTATLESAGPTVLAAGMTTVVSLLSFLTMDLRPMRMFGLFTAIGVLATLILSLTFVPAVIRLLKLKGRAPAGPGPGLRVLEATMLGVQRHRWLVGGALALIAAAGITFALQVDARVELSKLFARGSEPDRATRFMRARFGGSEFMQLYLEGDMQSPPVLRQLQWIADRVAVMPGVASVIHVGEALERANEAMEGTRRIPASKDKARLLYALMSSDSSIGQLVTPDHRHALIHVKLRADGAKGQERLLERIEHWIAHALPARYRVVERGPAAQHRRRELALAQIERLGRAIGHPLAAAARKRVERALAALGDEVAAARPAVVAQLQRFLRSEENAVPLASGEAISSALAAAIASLGPGASQARLRQALLGVQGSRLAEADIEDLLLGLSAPVEQIWQRSIARRRAHGVAALAGFEPTYRAAPERVEPALTAALLDLDQGAVLLPADDAAGSRSTTLPVKVSGQPVLHRALSRSSVKNQIKSLGAALIPVIVIMALRFRALRTGLLVACPTLLTLVVIYGGMGILGVQLDIGTAMLACIILGAGVDYAVHLVAGWQAERSLADAARRSLRDNGAAIWINALMVAIGFGVLTMGEARPLQNVGGMTAVAMLVAALATFVVVPVLARRRQYGRAENQRDTLDDSDPESVEVVAQER